MRIVCVVEYIVAAGWNHVCLVVWHVVLEYGIGGTGRVRLVIIEHVIGLLGLIGRRVALCLGVVSEYVPSLVTGGVV